MNTTTPKKKLLFVDDEINILNGIRRMLYPMRNEWEMEFVTSGKEALALMKTRPFDVVISDMRMPDIDGAQLLKEIMDIYPQTIRFILSGHCDKEMILKTIGPTHRFLAKPCDPFKLKEAIARACDSHKMLDKKQIKVMISKLKTLPTIPELYVKLSEALNSPNSSLADIGRIVQRDVSMTAKVLQMVNSAYFGLVRRVENVNQAVTYLGVETIKTLVLTIGLFDKFSKELVERFEIKKLYAHSIVVGTLATKIVQSIPTRDTKLADEAIMAGMLHDIGKLIFINNNADEYEKIYQRSKDENKPLYIIENEAMGISHAEIGGYLMDLWGLPINIVKTITFHHEPSRSLSSLFSDLSAVHVANALESEQSTQDVNSNSKIDLKYLINIKAVQHLTKWRELAGKIVSEEKKKEETIKQTIEEKEANG
ncbi:MAG: response regulator [bacterium]